MTHRGVRADLSILLIMAVVSGVCSGKAAANCDADLSQPRGSFFDLKSYHSASLPNYQALKGQLPSPIADEQPLWIETYWKSWELAFRNFREPAVGSGFVSQFIDPTYNEDIFLWDSSFMSLFTNVASPLVPGISSLDNFYAKQHTDGEISREIVRATGEDFEYWTNRDCEPLFSRLGWHEQERLEKTSRWPVRYRGRAAPIPNPNLTLDALDNPVVAWAELESYRVTGDKSRLARVWEPLRHYYEALQKYLRQGDGLYITDWASMDNSARNAYLEDGGTGIDISSQMVLFARNLAEIARILGKPLEQTRYTGEADALAKTINQSMWDEAKQFYFDQTQQGQQVPVRTIGAYWALLARVASAGQARALALQLKNPQTFGRPNAVPTLAADEPSYDPKGGYWNGAVWAPTTTMVIRGLEAYGYTEQARRIALNHLDLIAKVYGSTGTIWENYSPEAPAPGEPAQKDFVGWSGIGPILYLLEYGIGLKPDAAQNELTWNLRGKGRQGCDRYRFNGHVLSLVADTQTRAASRRRISVESDGQFTLRIVVNGRSTRLQVRRGYQEFSVRA
jgi:hypothetical protein